MQLRTRPTRPKIQPILARVRPATRTPPRSMAFSSALPRKKAGIPRMPQQTKVAIPKIKAVMALPDALGDAATGAAGVGIGGGVEEGGRGGWVPFIEAPLQNRPDGDPGAFLCGYFIGPTAYETREQGECHPKRGGAFQNFPRGAASKKRNEGVGQGHEPDQKEDRSHGVGVESFQKLSLGQVGEARGKAAGGTGNARPPMKPAGGQEELFMGSQAPGIGMEPIGGGKDEPHRRQDHRISPTSPSIHWRFF